MSNPDPVSVAEPSRIVTTESVASSFDDTPGEETFEKAIDSYRQWLARCTEVCEEAAKGNLEMRLLHADACEDFAPLMHGINRLLDMTDAFMRESFAALDHAGKGKFYRRVLLRGMLGSFRNTSKLINQATEEMSRSAQKLQESEQLRLTIADQFETSVRKVVSALSTSAGQVKQTASQLAHAAGEKQAAEESGRSRRAPGSKELEGEQHLNSVVANLAEASQKIGGVVKLISQIAAQTNLLALNATIEAARAGEAGKGFAVVASEVKSLARQTTSATEGISREIAAMRNTASRTAVLVQGMSSTIQTMTQISDELSQHAEELGCSVDAFLTTIRS